MTWQGIESVHCAHFVTESELHKLKNKQLRIFCCFCVRIYNYFRQLSLVGSKFDIVVKRQTLKLACRLLGKCRISKNRTLRFVEKHTI
jgi:hypothetical protein